MSVYSTIVRGWAKWKPWNFNILYLTIYWTQKVHNDFIFLSSLHCVPSLQKCMDTCRKKFFWLDCSHSCTACYTSSSDLKNVMNFLVHSYTCCSDRHASPYWTFIRRWISMGFTPLLLKNGWQNTVLLWCLLQAGPPPLHYYCAVVLHSCIVLPPVSHSSNPEYRCCERTKRSNGVLNLYHTFKVFMWLSLV
jgi:hypothetical protein